MKKKAKIPSTTSTVVELSGEPLGVLTVSAEDHGIFIKDLRDSIEQGFARILQWHRDIDEAHENIARAMTLLKQLETTRLTDNDLK